MNVEAFRNKAKDRPRTHISSVSYAGLKWSEWYKLAAMTRGIEYGCRFGRQIRNNSIDDHFTCVKQREYKYTVEQCCCSSCEASLGYLRFIQNDPKVIKRIAKLFQPKVGFWRKNKGCVLPRKYRSAVCLGYQCEAAKRYTIYGAKGVLVLFMDSIRMRRLSDKDIRILGRALLKTSS